MNTQRAAAAQKARDRANRPTRRLVGTVAEVSGTVAKIEAAGRTLPAVIPASVPGVALGKAVQVRDGKTPVIESVLESPTVGVVPLPGGLQMCFATFSITNTSSASTAVTWTYPRAFSATPTCIQVTARTNSTAVDNVSYYGETATSCEVRIVRTNNATTPISVLAIGPA